MEERVLELKEARQTFTFEGLAEEAGEPVLSVLRGFSAPVTLQLLLPSELEMPRRRRACLPYALCLMPDA